MTNRKYDEILELLTEADRTIGKASKLADNGFQTCIVNTLAELKLAITELADEQFAHTYDGHGGNNG